MVPPVDVSLKIEPLSHCVCCTKCNESEDKFRYVWKTDNTNEFNDVSMYMTLLPYSMICFLMLMK